MSRPDVNVVVSGPIQGHQTYKTVVLKSNIGFAEQVTDPNTKYVIKWNFDLGGGTFDIDFSNADTHTVAEVTYYYIPFIADESKYTLIDDTLVFIDAEWNGLSAREIKPEKGTLFMIASITGGLHKNGYGINVVTVPENCILEFDGGSLDNGVIVGQDTLVINVGDVDIWGENLTREGTWREHSGGGGGASKEFTIDDLVAGGRLNSDGKVLYSTEPTNISSKRLYRLVSIDEIQIDFIEPITSFKWVWYNSDGVYIGDDYYTSSKTIKVPVNAKNGYVGFSTGGTLTVKQVFDSIISCNLFDCDSIDRSALDSVQDGSKATCPTFTRFAVTNAVFEDNFCTIGPDADHLNHWYPQDESTPNKLLYLRKFNPYKIRIENYCTYPVYYAFVPGVPQAGGDAVFTTENGARILRSPIYDYDGKHYDTDQPYVIDESIAENSICLWLGNGGHGITEGVYVSIYGNNIVKEVGEKVDNIENCSKYLRHLSQTECHCMHWNIGHYSAMGAFASDIITKTVYEKKLAEINRIIDTYSTGPKGVYTFNEFSDVAGKYVDGNDTIVVQSSSLFPGFDNWFDVPTNRWTYNALASKFAFLTDVVFHRFPESIVPHEETDYAKSASYRRGISYCDDAYFVTGSLYISEQYVKFINVHLPFIEGRNTQEECLRYIIENFDSGYIVIVGDFNMESEAVESILQDYPLYVRYNNTEPTEINIDTLETKVLDHVVTKRVTVSNFAVGSYREKEEGEEYTDYMVSDHCPIFFTLSIPAKYENNVVIRKSDVQNLMLGSGTRQQRSSIAKNPLVGYCYFDTDIHIPTYWSGNVNVGDAGWVDCNGLNPYDPRYVVLETIYQDQFESCGATIVSNSQSPDYNKYETSSPARYYGAAVDVERYAGLKCTITPDTNGTSFAFVTDTEFIGGENVNYATGYDTIQRITSETTVDIPADAKRLFVLMRSGDTFYTPQKVEIKQLVS